MGEKLAKLNQSLEKALIIIDIMVKSKGPMRLQDIAHEADIPPSTALRMLNTLATYGYVIQDEETKRYFLSLKFAQIGSITISRLNIRDLAHPFLLELSETCGEACCLALEHGMEAIYTDVVEGPDSMVKIMQRIGKLVPLHSTGVGKLLLLNYSPAQLEHFAAVKGLPRLTKNTIHSLPDLKKELDVIRRQGYAYDNEECELGARCVAAPIYNYTGRIIGGISISGPVSRMSFDRIGTITPNIVSTAKEISLRLSYNENN